MTIRGLVKKELIAQGYPVEKSHWHKGKIVYNKYIEQPGVELERESFNKYQRSMNRPDKVEILKISCNGYIEKDKMQEIVDKCMDGYNPWRTETQIYIY